LEIIDPIAELKNDSISYPFEHAPEPATILEVAPSVYWLRMPLPFALNHINLWMVEEDDGWTIIDTGLNIDKIKQHWDALIASQCGEKPIKRIVVTHCHPDHLGLASWLERKTGAPVWATQGEMLTANAWYYQLPGHDLASMVELYRTHGLDAALLETMADRGPTYKGRVDMLPTRYGRLIDGDTLQLGQHEWRIIMGYGHSPEHASLYCAALGVLIAGDMLLPRITTNISVQSANPDGNPLLWFLDSIERFKDLPADTLVLPSHGHPFRGLSVRLAQLRAHHEERLQLLLSACDTPKSAGDLLCVLFNRELDAHQVMFAMGETIAHLNYLKHAGSLHTLRDANGVIRFVNRL